ncbi:MAG: radical SAM protein, partial [Thermoprotei archaeon]
MRAERSAERLRVVGLWRGRLPRGCELCMRGLKVVVFVTGFCEANCYYCPVGIGRRDPDALYVDEERVDSLDRVLEEIEVVGARGISITGGEPLSAIERVEKILRLVKDVYGQGFHVHLYTHGGYATREVLRRLDRLGLDEIRFHPRYPQSFRSLEYAARETSMDVGVEVPAIPGAAEGLCRVAAYAERLGARFININELEYSES